MKVCRTCEHVRFLPARCIVHIGPQPLFDTDNQSCTNHKERAEKKKALLRAAIMKWPNGPLHISNISEEDLSGDKGSFIRWATAEDWQNIMQCKEVEI